MPNKDEDVNLCIPYFEKEKYIWEVFENMCQVHGGSWFPPSWQPNIKLNQVDHHTKTLKKVLTHCKFSISLNLHLYQIGNLA